MFAKTLNVNYCKVTQHVWTC